MSKEGGSIKPLATDKMPIVGDFNSLYEELLYRCDPARFMEPYDKEKVDIANSLYAKILQNENNIDVLKQLRAIAIKDLKVKFSTRKLYMKLKTICEPSYYTGTEYNEDLLSLSNRLYSQIRENADDIEKLEEIESQAGLLKKLYQEREEREHYELKENKRIEEKRIKIEKLKLELNDIKKTIYIIKRIIPFVFSTVSLFVLVHIMISYGSEYTEETIRNFILYGIVVVLILLLYMFVISSNISERYDNKKTEIEKQIDELEQ